MHRLADLPLLYMSRHGQTSWNFEGRFQGQEDIPLNDLGRQQAARNGRCLAELIGSQASEFQFLCSPLERARETMIIIRREMGLAPLDFVIDPRLPELHFGAWQGYTLNEIAERDPQGLARREQDKWDFLPDGASGESYQLLSERISPLFKELSTKTVIVAHGGVIRAFLKLYGEISKDEAAHYPIPQDKILRITNGRAEWL